MITENARKNSMHTVFYADALILLSDTMSGLRETFFRWKNIFEEKGLRINISKTSLDKWCSSGNSEK